MSNLRFLSKILEKVVTVQLSDHMKRNGLLDQYQSAYRMDHSCETALLKLHNDIIRAMADRKVVLLVLLDMTAAFDTVNHRVLLTILQHLGVTDCALNWFKSYLYSRTQKINISGTYSSSKDIPCGVPQGSVLGPILFTTYIMALGKIIDKHLIGYHFYADDLQIYVSCDYDNIQDVMKKLERCLEDVRVWLNGHQLKMNAKKTEFLVLTSKHMNPCPNPETMKLCIGDALVQPSCSARNLRVILDSHLSFEKHIANTCKTSYMQLRTLQKIKPYLDRETLEIVIHAFVSSKLDFCNSLLYGASQQQIRKLQLIQNAAARLLTGTKKSEHITPILRNLHWLPIISRIKFKILVIVYKTLHRQSPQYLQNLIQPYTPGACLRSADRGLLTVPFNRLTVGDSAFSVAGPRLWNSLPSTIRCAKDLNDFKSMLKTHLFRQHFN